MRTAADYHATARRVGGRVTSSHERPGRVGATIDVWGAWAGPKLLEALSRADLDRSPRTLALGLNARRHIPDTKERARRLLGLVQSAVEFERENGEVFRAPDMTLARGAGDCDDSARLLVALARAAGLRARFAYLERAGQPVHVYAEIDDGTGYKPAEATIRARFGEAPLDAATRLGVRARKDLVGTPRYLGALGDMMNRDLFTTADSWTAGANMLLRMVVEAPATMMPGDVRADLAALGFVNVVVTDDAGWLDLTWESMAKEVTSSAGKSIFWVQAQMGPIARKFDRELPNGREYVRRAEQVDQFAAPPLDPAEYDENDLPSVPAMPESGSRSAWARIVLMHAWRRVHGRTGPELTDTTVQGVLAICNLETDMLRKSAKAPGGALLWNWGNVHCRDDRPLKDGETCDGRVTGSKYALGCSTAADADNAGKVYKTCFRKYAGPIEGMCDLVQRLSAGQWTYIRGALATGDAQVIAEAMAKSGYYGFNPPPDIINRYAEAIAGSAALVATKLGQPKMVQRGTPAAPEPPPDQGGGGLLALAVGIGAYALAKGWVIL